MLFHGCEHASDAWVVRCNEPLGLPFALASTRVRREYSKSLSFPKNQQIQQTQPSENNLGCHNSFKALCCINLIKMDAWCKTVSGRTPAVPTSHVMGVACGPNLARRVLWLARMGSCQYLQPLNCTGAMRSLPRRGLLETALCRGTEAYKFATITCIVYPCTL